MRNRALPIEAAVAFLLVAGVSGMRVALENTPQAGGNGMRKTSHHPRNSTSKAARRSSSTTTAGLWSPPFSLPGPGRRCRTALVRGSSRWGVVRAATPSSFHAATPSGGRAEAVVGWLVRGVGRESHPPYCRGGHKMARKEPRVGSSTTARSRARCTWATRGLPCHRRPARRRCRKKAHEREDGGRGSSGVGLSRSGRTAKGIRTEPRMRWGYPEGSGGRGIYPSARIDTLVT